MPVTGSRFCDDCKVDINRKGWSKHEKTDKHKLNMKFNVSQQAVDESERSSNISSTVKQTEVKAVSQGAPPTPSRTRNFHFNIVEDREYNMYTIESNYANKEEYFKDRQKVIPSYRVRITNTNNIEYEDINNLALISKKYFDGNKCKITISFSANFHKLNGNDSGNDGDNEKVTEKHFNFHQPITLLNHDSFNDNVVSEITTNIKSIIDETKLKESGWVFQNITKFTCDYSKTKILTGGTYTDLPDIFEKNKKVIINIRNRDACCILYCIAAKIFPVKQDRANPANYVNHVLSYLHMLTRAGYNIYECFPFQHHKDNYKVLENVFGVIINVFEIKGDTIIPVIVNNGPDNITINLLLHNRHYSLIDRINYYIRGSKHAIYCCINCLNYSGKSKECLDNHQEMCFNNKPFVTTFEPKYKIFDPQTNKCILLYNDDELNIYQNYKRNTLKFKNHHYKIPPIFWITADFETISVPTENKVENCECGKHNNNENSLSSSHCKHGTLFNQYPISYVYYIHSELTDEQQILYFDKVITGSYEYYGDDCVEHFVEAINNLNTGFSTFYNSAKYKECNLTTEEEHEFQQSKLCHLCDNEIYPHTGNKDFKKVRDHCHYTGKFRGAAHSCCNITATEKKQSFVPILFHNGSGYDFHLFIDQLVSKAHEVFWAETKAGVMVSKFDQNFKLLSKNDEEYISITYGKMRFLDSFRFLSSSLDKLGKSLDDFPIMKKVLGESFDKILTTKLAFPYEYFNTSEDDSKVLLLTKKDFYSHIRQGYPTDVEISRRLKLLRNII